MTDSPTLPQAGQTVTPWPQPVALSLRVPEGRTIATADLSLQAVTDAVEDLTPLSLQSDRGGLKPDDAVRWVSAVFDGEATLVALTIQPAPAGPSPTTLPVAARVKVLSGGAWMPLAPLDVVALGAAQTFPPVVASQVFAELLVQTPAPAAQVPLPGAIHVTSVALRGTRQPGHVALAVGEDSPFFTHPGPLPLTGVVVPGLARVAGRFLLDHPGSTEIPLRLSAAGQGAVRLGFAGTLDPAPKPDTGGGGGGTGGGREANVETVYLDVPAPLLAKAQLCDAGHIAVQGFGPLPAGTALSSFDVLVRTPGATGSFELYADQKGRPAGTPLAGGAVGFAATGDSSNAPAWLTARLPIPVTPPGAWWLLCRVTQGECLWYVAAARPDRTAVGASLSRIDSGAWTPAPAAPDGWAQTRLRTLPTPAPPA